jgi:NADH dehydrogenase
MAVANSRALFQAARAAGIERIVHVSITNPSLDSPYPYFQRKAQVERMLAESGVPHAIVRPAILFGRGDVLINNIAWLLRHSPVFAIGGAGAYRIRAIHVDDLARLCISLGARTETVTVDAVGPQSLSFRRLVEAVRSAIGSHAVIVSVPGPVLTTISRALGVMLRDSLLTPDEYHAMADGLADSDAPTNGEISLTEWIGENADILGRNYANELDRHYRTAEVARVANRTAVTETSM